MSGESIIKTLSSTSSSLTTKQDIKSSFQENKNKLTTYKIINQRKVSSKISNVKSKSCNQRPSITHHLVSFCDYLS